uniref:Putative secreted protein n=1 Tax=Ixodes ricinus TaxID=34613 RepID=A0A6B0U9Z4_IXORI
MVLLLLVLLRLRRWLGVLRSRGQPAAAADVFVECRIHRSASPTPQRNPKERSPTPRFRAVRQRNARAHNKKRGPCGHTDATLLARL